MSHKTRPDRVPSTHAPPLPSSLSEAHLTGIAPTDAMRSEASSTEAIPSHAISAEAAHTEAVSIEPTPVLQNSGAVFHLCSKLPLELRTMILRVLIDETRTIKVVHAGPSSKSMLTSPAVTSRRPLCQLEDKQIPALLHASKDTREIALKFYKAVSPDFLANPFYYNETFDTLSLSSAGIAVSKAIWWTNISEMRISTLAINMSCIPDVEFTRQLLELEEREYRLDEKNQLQEWCELGFLLVDQHPDSLLVEVIEIFNGALGKVLISDSECEKSTTVGLRKVGETVNLEFQGWFSCLDWEICIICMS